MADYNSVPLGQAGTGAAFILGDDNASKIFNRNLSNITAVNQQNELRKQQQAQLLAKSYRDNLLAASSGKLFAQQLGEIEQKHLKQGMDYRGQGWDIYNPDPNDQNQIQAATQYMADRRQIENLRAYRKGIEDRFNKNSEKLAGAKAGDYDPESIKAMNDFVANGNIVDIYNSGQQLPEISQAFKISEALKGIKAPTFETMATKNGIITNEKYIDPDDAEKTVISTLSNSPAGLAQLNKVTQGLPINEVRRMPKTHDAIKKDILKDAGGDPRIKTALAASGIKIGTPAFTKWADTEAQRLYRIKSEFDGLVQNGVNQISNGVATFKKRKSEMTPYQRESLALRRQAAARANGGQINPQLDARLKLIQDIQSFTPNAAETLGAFVNGNPEYDSGSKFAIRANPEKPNDNNHFVIDIPAKVKIGSDGDKQVVTPRQLYSLNRSDPNFDVRMNEVINNVSGQRMDIGASVGLRGNTKGSTKKVATAPQNVPKTISKSQVASKAAIAGYSVAEYTKLLQQKGIKIQ